VRRMIHRESMRRGRPLLLSVRVPMTEFHALTRSGLDIRTWLQEGLVDVLVTGGGYVPLSMPTSELVELGHRYGVPVYPTISASGVRSRVPGGRLDAGSPEGWRGAAANAWFAGADGILSFNLFPNGVDTDRSRFVAGVWNDMGDPRALARQTKLFGIEHVLSYYNAADLTHAIPLEGRCPLTVGAESVETTPLLVADDLAAAAADQALETLEFRAYVEELQPGTALHARLNGHELGAGTPAAAETGAWVTFTVKAAQFRRGPNRLAFRVEGDGPVTVGQVELFVEYRG